MSLARTPGLFSSPFFSLPTFRLNPEPDPDMNTATEPTVPASKISGTITTVATSRIEPDPNQPRRHFAPERIHTLAESIKSEGLLQPITVGPNPAKPGYFMILTGERRWRAHCHAGIQTIKCIISTKFTTDQARRLRAQVIENKGREDTSLKEDAFACKHLTDLGDTDEAIATVMCVSVARMKNIRRMTMLSEAIWALIEAGRINAAVAEYVMGHVPDESVEPLLLQLKDKGRNQGAVIVDTFVDEMNQAAFALTCDEAGITSQKDSVVRKLAVQLMQVTTLVEKLPSEDRAKLARQFGAEVASVVPKGKSSKRGALFLTTVMQRVNNEL